MQNDLTVSWGDISWLLGDIATLADVLELDHPQCAALKKIGRLAQSAAHAYRRGNRARLYLDVLDLDELSQTLTPMQLVSTLKREAAQLKRLTSSHFALGDVHDHAKILRLAAQKLMPQGDNRNLLCLRLLASAVSRCVRKQDIGEALVLAHDAQKTAAEYPSASDLKSMTERERERTLAGIDRLREFARMLVVRVGKPSGPELDARP